MTKAAFEGLEPYDGKLSRTVLKGERGRKTLDLPGVFSGGTKSKKNKDIKIKKA